MGHSREKGLVAFGPSAVRAVRERRGKLVWAVLTAGGQPRRSLACAHILPVIVEEGNSLLEASKLALEAPGRRRWLLALTIL